MAEAAHPRARRLSWLRGTLGRFLSRHHPLSFLPAGPQHTRSSPLVPGMNPGFTQAEMGLVPVLWFFLISGFVITWTIDRCRTPMDFIVSSHLPPLPRLLGRTRRLRSCSAWCGRCRAPPSPPGQIARERSPCCRTSSAFLAVDGVYWSLTVELRFYAYALADLHALGQWRRVQLVALAWSLAGTGSRRAQRHGRLGPLAPAAIADDPIRPVPRVGHDDLPALAPPSHRHLVRRHSGPAASLPCSWPTVSCPPPPASSPWRCSPGRPTAACAGSPPPLSSGSAPSPTPYTSRTRSPASRSFAPSTTWAPPTPPRSPSPSSPPSCSPAPSATASNAPPCASG